MLLIIKKFLYILTINDPTHTQSVQICWQGGVAPMGSKFNWLRWRSWEIWRVGDNWKGSVNKSSNILLVVCVQCVLHCYIIIRIMIGPILTVYYCKLLFYDSKFMCEYLHWSCDPNDKKTMFVNCICRYVALWAKTCENLY